MEAETTQQNTPGFVTQSEKPLDEKQIKALQGNLRALGHDINIDGKAGPETEAALNEFIKKHDLNMDAKLDEEALEVVQVTVGQSDTVSAQLKQMQAAEVEFGAADLWAMYALESKGFMVEMTGTDDPAFKSTLNKFADYLKFAPDDKSYRTANAGQKVIELNDKIEEIELAQNEFIKNKNLPLKLDGVNNMALIDEQIEKAKARLESTDSPDFYEKDAEGNLVDKLVARADANTMLTWLLQMKGMENDRWDAIREKNGILSAEYENVNVTVSHWNWERMTGKQLVDATIIEAGIQLNKGEYKELLNSSRELALDGTHATATADFFIEKFGGDAELHDAIEKYESIPVSMDEILEIQNRQREEGLAQNKNYMAENGILKLDEQGNIAEITDQKMYDHIVNGYVTPGGILLDQLRDKKFAEKYPDDKTPQEITKEKGIKSYSTYAGNARIGGKSNMKLEGIQKERELEAARNQQPYDMEEKTALREILEKSADAVHDAALNCNEDQKINLIDSVIAAEIKNGEDGVLDASDKERIKEIMAEMGYDDPNYRFDVTNPEEFAKLQQAVFAHSAKGMSIEEIPAEINEVINELAYEVNGKEAPAEGTSAAPAASASPDAAASTAEADNATTAEQQRAEETRRVAEKVNNSLPSLNSL